jgi:hypothetical protein
MVSNPILFTIVIFSALAIGGIGVGIYIASFNSKPENKNKRYSIVAISFIMLASLLAGIMLCLILYLVRQPEKQCPTCGWGEEDIKMVKKAQQVLESANKKVQKIPRDMAYVTHCEAGEEECGVKVTPSLKIQKSAGEISPEGSLVGKDTFGANLFGSSSNEKISEKLDKLSNTVSKMNRELERRLKSE